MDRRFFLKSATVAMAGTAFGGCAKRVAVQAPAAVQAAVVPSPPGLKSSAYAWNFAPVKVSPDRVIRTVVGLRPFRPSGFLVRADRMDRKTVVHNYGHGGGMTLSWGTSHLAVEEALKTSQTKYAVLGCGGVGLATARLLQRRGFDVTIYAKDLPPATTSNVACAQWSPATVVDTSRRTPEWNEQFVRAARLANRYFQDFVGDYYGVHWIPNYSFSRIPVEPNTQGTRSSIQDLYPGSRDLGKDEHPFDYPYVQQFWTMLIEPPIYLNAVMRDFLLAGGKLVVRDFKNLDEVLALPEPVIMNCTGLGAKSLFGDEQLVPIKGQLTVLLPQPEVNYIALADNGLYMMPRKDGILLGGTHERGEWSLEPNLEAKDRILKGHAEFYASMNA